MSNINLSVLNGRNGFIIPGLDENALLGDALSTVGDINGDGIADIVIGARNTRIGNNNNAGKVYVIFGAGNTNFTPSFALSQLDGSNGFSINGLAADDRLGIAVSNAGDVNNDGIDDLIVGANGSNDTGTSYVVFGRNSFTPSLDLAALNGSNGFAINGLAAGDLFGTSVSNAGDVNADGIADIIVSATDADSNGNPDTGTSYVVFGREGGFTPTLDLATLNGGNGFRINGINPSDFSGSSVSSAGDLNGDGIDDLIVGANFANPGDRRNAGQVAIVFGRSGNFDPTVNLASLNGTNGLRINGIEERDGAGVSVADAGDVNGDGFADIVIGANYADVGDRENAGQAYVIFGSDQGFEPNIRLAELNGTNGFTINGIATDDLLGTSVNGAGDVNNDGIDDLVLGARGANETAGASYIIYGSETPANAVLELADLNVNQGFRINNRPNSRENLLGQAVSGAGDLNNDGIDDLLLGAPVSDPEGISNAGESYVIFGRVTYLGDINNDLAYTNADVYGISRLAVGLDSELSAYPGIDPLLVADVNSDGVISAFDASIVAGAVNGIDSPFLREITP